MNRPIQSSPARPSTPAAPRYPSSFPPRTCPHCRTVPIPGALYCCEATQRDYDMKQVDRAIKLLRSKGYLVVDQAVAKGIDFSTI